MVALASDHAGFAYKERLKPLLDQLKIDYRDYGAHTSDSTDYPDWAHPACGAISSGTCERGIFICGTGIGMSIIANKHLGIRAAACESVEAARLARLHNNANVLAFGERLLRWEAVVEIVTIFLQTPFEGGRHERRIQKIHALTQL
ncbi:MAG: ribose 5-phosphate isomerase B [bacterium]